MKNWNYILHSLASFCPIDRKCRKIIICSPFLLSQLHRQRRIFQVLCVFMSFKCNFIHNNRMQHACDSINKFQVMNRFVRLFCTVLFSFCLKTWQNCDREKSGCFFFSSFHYSHCNRCFTFYYCDFTEADRHTKNRINKFRFRYYYMHFGWEMQSVSSCKCSKHLQFLCLFHFIIYFYNYIAGGVPYRY